MQPLMTPVFKNHKGSPSNTTVSSTSTDGSVASYKCQHSVKDMLMEADLDVQAGFAKDLGVDMDLADYKGQGEAIRAHM